MPNNGRPQHSNLSDSVTVGFKPLSNLESEVCLTISMLWPCAVNRCLELRSPETPNDQCVTTKYETD
jgi:hypothetical protein